MRFWRSGRFTWFRLFGVTFELFRPPQQVQLTIYRGRQR